MKKAIVIGAGISGLTAAYWLKQKNIDVTIIEKQSRVGGVIETERADGFLFEKGPNSFLDNAPDTLELCQRLNLENELLKQAMRGNPRYIYLHEKLIEVPTGPGGLFKTELLSKQAKRKLFTEPFRRGNRSPQDESLANFMRRRLGDEILQNLVTPFVSGVYAGDPEKLSLRGTFPFLYDLERQSGSLIWGMLKKGLARKKKNDQKKKKPRAKNLCSFVDGLHTLPQTIARELESNLKLQTSAVSIKKRDGGGYSIETQGAHNETLDADAVVCAMPAYALPEVLDDSIVPTNYFQEIAYNRLCLLWLGWPKDAIKHSCDGFGFLSPRGQNIRMLGSIFNSSLFVRRAPAAQRNFSIFIGGGLDPSVYDLSDEEIISTVKQDMQNAVGAEGEPSYCKINRWERAIPQYPIGHVEQIENIKSAQRQSPGFFLTGNYLDGVSVNDCIRNGKTTAEEIESYFNS